MAGLGAETFEPLRWVRLRAIRTPDPDGTIVVFDPPTCIHPKGLVGAFFLPFALTISFALVASLVVA